MWNQEGLRQHLYKQSYWRWGNSSWAISNPKRWCYDGLHSICQQIWKMQQWPQDWKRCFHSNPKERQSQRMLKFCSHTAQLHSSHMLVQRRQWHPTPVLSPGNSQGWRSLVGCGPWGCTTEWHHYHFPLSCIGEGNGNPLQNSCLENPRDRRACWAAVYGVAQSWTWLTWLSGSSWSEVSKTGKYNNILWK